jgi:hypothetical protein
MGPRIHIPGIGHDVRLAHLHRNTARLNPSFRGHFVQTPLGNGIRFAEPGWDSQGVRAECAVIGGVCPLADPHAAPKGKLSDITSPVRT